MTPNRLNPFAPSPERREELDAWQVTRPERRRDTVLRFAAGAGTLLVTFTAAIFAGAIWSWPGATLAVFFGGLVAVLELHWIRGYMDEWYADRAERRAGDQERVDVEVEP